jgi:hypothetical protein
MLERIRKHAKLHAERRAWNAGTPEEDAVQRSLSRPVLAPTTRIVKAAQVEHMRQGREQHALSQAAALAPPNSAASPSAGSPSRSTGAASPPHLATNGPGSSPARRPNTRPASAMGAVSPNTNTAGSYSPARSTGAAGKRQAHQRAHHAPQPASVSELESEVAHLRETIDVLLASRAAQPPRPRPATAGAAVPRGRAPDGIHSLAPPLPLPLPLPHAPAALVSPQPTPAPNLSTSTSSNNNHAENMSGPRISVPINPERLKRVVEEHNANMATLEAVLRERKASEQRSAEVRKQIAEMDAASASRTETENHPAPQSAAINQGLTATTSTTAPPVSEAAPASASAAPSAAASASPNWRGEPQQRQSDGLRYADSRPEAAPAPAEPQSATAHSARTAPVLETHYDRAETDRQQESGNPAHHASTAARPATAPPRRASSALPAGRSGSTSKGKSISAQRAEEDRQRREAELEAHLHFRFKAKPVPHAATIPLFAQIQARQETKRRLKHEARFEELQVSQGTDCISYYLH